MLFANAKLARYGAGGAKEMYTNGAKELLDFRWAICSPRRYAGNLSEALTCGG
jgi:hypothetical protein